MIRKTLGVSYLIYIIMENSDDEILDPNGLFTQEEKDAILEYRRTGKLPHWPYEELDFDSVGGILPDDED